MISTEVLEECASGCFIQSIKEYHSKDFWRCFRDLALARELYIFLEDVKMIELCNLNFNRFIEKRDYINRENVELFYEYGKQKADFIIGLAINGREFINRKIKE